MFRKPSTVGGAPKIKAKCKHKYGLIEGPKIEPWSTKSKAKNGSESEPQEDTKEDIVDKGRLKAEQATVSRFKRENQTDKEVTLFVRGLAPQVNDTMIYEIFSKHGAVVRHNIVRNHGISWGYGFICFKHPEEAAQALHCTNGIEIYKKTIYVSEAQDQQERTAFVQNIFASRAIAVG